MYLCILTYFQVAAARYGLIVTIDEAGEVREFVFSGLTPDEERQFAEWLDGPRLFAHFRDLLGPSQLADLPNYFRALGFSSESDAVQDLPGHWSDPVLVDSFGLSPPDRVVREPVDAKSSPYQSRNTHLSTGLV